MKPIRKAVKCILIENGKIVITKYLKGSKIGYYDIPGGKIEDGETPKETAIREMREETGIEILDLIKRGSFEVEYPNRVFIFDVFMAKQYKGNPQNFEENISKWIDIGELLKKKKILSNILMLRKPYNKALYNEKINFYIKVEVDEEENILKFEYEETKK